MLFFRRLNSEPSWRKRKQRNLAKWQQGEEEPFLEQVEKLVDGPYLQCDTNSYDWYKWNGINNSSQAVKATMICGCSHPFPTEILFYSVSKNSIWMNSSKGTSCRLWLTTWCLTPTPPHEFLEGIEISIL